MAIHPPATHTGRTPDALLFVYNANAGMMAGLLDTVHKTLSPATYDCQLCAVTYGALAMRPPWRDWLKAQSWAAQFYHRPDFRATYPAFADLPLPAVLRRDGVDVSLLIDTQTIRGLETIDALIDAIVMALAR